MKRFFALVMAVAVLTASAVAMTGCGSETADNGQADIGSGNGGNSAQGNGNADNVNVTADRSAEEVEADLKAAQEAFVNLVTAIKVGDSEAAGKYIDTGSLSDVSVEGLDGGDAVLEAVFSKLESQIVSSAINADGSVTIVANITTIDLTGLLGQCTNIVMKEIASGKISTDQLDARIDEVFREEMMKEGIPTVVNQVDTKVKKLGDVWKVEMTDTFKNAISGGFLGQIAKAQQSMSN